MTDAERAAYLRGAHDMQQKVLETFSNAASVAERDGNPDAATMMRATVAILSALTPDDLLSGD